ncbi:MAG: hypothetical protein HY347_04485 [candidate division NC10 bacterium]|nr:hypothetical protein [candidate division NC10 bacterium]
MRKVRRTSWPKGVSGNPQGRPKGAKDHVPRSVKASIKAVFEELGQTDYETWKEAIRRTLAKGGRDAFPYFQLAAYYLDGKPVETVKVQTPQPIVIKFSSGLEEADEAGQHEEDAEAEVLGRISLHRS